MLLTPLSSITGPQMIKMDKPARKLNLKSIDISAFRFHISFFKSPEYIYNAAIGAINEGYTRYIPVAVCAGISETISIELKRDNNLGLCN